MDKQLTGRERGGQRADDRPAKARRQVDLLALAVHVLLAIVVLLILTLAAIIAFKQTAQNGAGAIVLASEYREIARVTAVVAFA